MTAIDWNAFLSPVLVSIQVTLLSSVLVFVAAVFAAKKLAKSQFRGKSILETILMLPLVLPPTVVGFLLLVALGRNSWIGQAVEWLFHQPLVFTWWAAVIAAVVVAFPLCYQTLKVGFNSIDEEIENVARCSGAKEWQVFWYITLPLSFRFLIAAFILGFARGFGEFGATLMIAGNIPGKTQTIPLAIYLAVDSGQHMLVWLWVSFMLLISFLMLWIANKR